MEKLKMTKKALVLSLAMLAVSPIRALAQEGLFQRGVSDEEYYGNGKWSNNKGVFENGNRSIETTGTINNQVFGQPVPLGSGIIVLLAAGAGYAALKRKEDKK